MKITKRQLQRIIKEEVKLVMTESLAPPKADFELVAEFEGLQLYNNITGETINLTDAAGWSDEDEGVDTEYYRRIAGVIEAEARKHGVTELWDGEEQEIVPIDQAVAKLHQVATDNEAYAQRVHV